MPALMDTSLFMAQSTVVSLIMHVCCWLVCVYVNTLCLPISCQLRSDLDGGGVRDSIRQSGSGSQTPREHWTGPTGVPELPRTHMCYSESCIRRETPHFRYVCS